MSGGYSYLFGPVRSRRLGRSLGIDLVPLKVCTWDCPYCQVGATTDKTHLRRDYVPVAGVLDEFDHWMAHDGQADVVTLAGGGEPTLHLHFGDIIEAVGLRSGLRRILLSNGSLFSLPEVRTGACKADVVKATFSAWDQVSLQALHQPHRDLSFDSFYSGLKAFRAEFTGEYWLEVFVVPGVNDTAECMARVATLAAEIRPDRIHLNTAVRPARDGVTQPVSAAVLAELAGLFSPMAEVIAVLAPAPPGKGVEAAGDVQAARILGLLQRHPCSPGDVSASLGLSERDAATALGRLCDSGKVRRERRDGDDFYLAL